MFDINLLSSQIHLYAIDLSQVPEKPELLEPFEQTQTARFKFEIHRTRYMNSHTALREIFMQYLGENPHMLATEKGKPYLKDFPEVQFNLSHAENAALVAITLNDPVGVDIEFIKKKSDYLGIAERFFAPEEFNFLTANPTPETFHQLWTRKEAYLKCLGTGITNGLHLPIPDHMFIYEFKPFAEYTAALVTPCQKEIIECGKIFGP